MMLRWKREHCQEMMMMISSTLSRDYDEKKKTTLIEMTTTMNLTMEMAMAMTMTKKFEQGNVLGWREFRSWLGKEDCEDDNNLDNEVDDEEGHEGGHNDIIDNDDDTSGKIVTRDRPRKRAMWQVAILRESLQQLPLLISIAMVINGQWSSNLNIFSLILWHVAILLESLQQLPSLVIIAMMMIAIFRS